MAEQQMNMKVIDAARDAFPTSSSRITLGAVVHVEYSAFQNRWPR